MAGDGLRPHRHRPDWEKGRQATNNKLHDGDLTISLGCLNLLGAAAAVQGNEPETGNLPGPDPLCDGMGYAAITYWPQGTVQLLAGEGR